MSQDLWPSRQSLRAFDPEGEGEESEILAYIGVHSQSVGDSPSLAGSSLSKVKISASQAILPEASLFASEGFYQAADLRRQMLDGDSDDEELERQPSPFSDCHRSGDEFTAELIVSALSESLMHTKLGGGVDGEAGRLCGLGGSSTPLRSLSLQSDDSFNDHLRIIKALASDVGMAQGASVVPDAPPAPVDMQAEADAAESARVAYMLEQIVSHGKPIEEVVVEMRHSTYIQSLALARTSGKRKV